MKRSSLAWVLIFGIMILRLTSVYFEVFRLAGPPTVDVDLWRGGSPPRPFATRVLVPGIIFGVSGIIPDEARQAVEAGGLHLPFAGLPSRLEYQVLGILVILSFAGYTVAMRKLVQATFVCSDLRANLITLASLLLMPVMFAYHNYFYDPMTLFLGTTLWYLLYRKRWTAVIPVYMLSCINKETAVVFALSAALWRNHLEGPQSSRRYFLILGVLGVGIRALISVLSSHYPGSAMQFHLIDHNLGHLYTFIDPASLASTLVISFLVFSFWSEKSEFVKIGTIHLAILVTLGVFVGYVDEYRLYFDCYPILVLMMAYSLIRLGTGAGLPVAAERPVAQQEI